jgi:outer membrane protein OmpA-like peptidoglycan-associated protein
MFCLRSFDFSALPGRPARERQRLLHSGKLRLIGAVMLGSGLTFGLPGSARAQDCTALLDAVTKAVDLGKETEAQVAVDRIAVDASCGRFTVAAQKRLSAFRLKAVHILMARGRPVADFDPLLTAAEKPRVLWQASATMGEVRSGERRFADAARAFDGAIEIVKNEALTPVPPSKFDIEGLIASAAQSRLLAASTRPDQGEAFVKTARNERDGKLGGFYSESVRGVTMRSIPVPITFEYAKTDFTSVGEEAARELLEAVKEQQPERIVLVGHTDVRGAAETNVRLSRERAEAVAKFLRENGVEASVQVIGKGATEPIRLTDTAGLSQDDIYALNRRVEWRRD